MSPLPPAGPSVPHDSALPDGARTGAAAAGARPAIQEAAERLAAGRPAEAAEALARLVAEAPTYAAAHVLHAVAREAAGQPDDALASWHRAASLVPRSPLVIRERARLLAALPPAVDEQAPRQTADATHADAAATDAPAAETLETEPGESASDAPSEVSWAHVGGATDADAETPRLVGDDAAEDDLLDDLPPLETLPLDDLAISFVPGAADDQGDAFDPDGFDFSAFDLGEDDAGWLTGLSGDTASPGAGEPDDAEPDVAEPDAVETDGSAWDDDALPDWSDAVDEPVTLMPPEIPADPDEAPPLESEPEADTWAVFQDEPAAPPAPLFDPAAFAPAPEPAPEPSVVDELDSLIASLEHAPRIRPDPTFNGPAVTSADVDVDAMASETLAKIYAAQRQYVQAALVYETLAAREPARAEAMLAQAAAMRQRRA